MRVLVVSDSHSGLSYMKLWATVLKPQVILHLGDYYEDGKVLEELFPGTRVLQVPGNCDRYRCMGTEPEIIFTSLDGVNIFMTHGHLHHVKSGLGGLIRTARTARADVAFYGHTHEALILELEDGLRVMNPGSCGSSGGSVGLMEIEQGKIVTFRILNRRDMEEFE